MNKYGIATELEREIRRRDTHCVYCHIRMTSGTNGDGLKATVASWEHIDNEGHASRENMALCCGSCNSSKGAKRLEDWLDSAYCDAKRITKNTVADIVKRTLA